MTTKIYRANCDNGRDYFSFLFYSEHRANSAANKKDAVRAWKLAHGYSSACKVTSTNRDEWDGGHVLG